MRLRHLALIALVLTTLSGCAVARTGVKATTTVAKTGAKAVF